MTHPPGTIILPNATGSVRYVQFAASMFTLEQPAGTTIQIVRSTSVAENTNVGIRRMTGEWVWLIADDHAFPSDIITRLLDHHVDIVVPVCCTRTPPFPLVLYREDGVKEWSGREYPAWKSLSHEDIPDDGSLITVDAAGSAGMLIRKHVLDAIGEPWFEFSPGSATNEDVLFCMKARAAGFDIHVDTSLLMGHLSDFAVWPDLDCGWKVDLGKGHVVEARQQVPA